MHAHRFNLSIQSKCVLALSIFIIPVINSKAATDESSSFPNSFEIYANSTIYLPLAFNSVTEIDIPMCRWPHALHQFTTIYFQWGTNLQTPVTPWCKAFEAGI